MYFAVTIGIRGYDMYKDAIAQVSLEDKINEIRSKKSYTLFSDLPETYTDAVLSVEDHRFYGHIGIDPIAITRAMVNDVKAGCFVEGGSTITQQLAKNLYFTQEKKMERKAAEVFMAFAPVSYTHLDVYKRQAHTLAHCMLASFDFAKIASPTVSVRLVGELVTIKGHR